MSDQQSFSYVEDFNDGVLNTLGWNYFARGQVGPTDEVSEHDGYLDIQTLRTDQGGMASLTFSAGITNAHISLDRFSHATSDNFFSSALLSFKEADGQDMQINFLMNRSSYGPDNGNDPQNYDHPKVVISDPSGYAMHFADGLTTSSLLDKWVTTEFNVDNTAGSLNVDVDHDGVTDIQFTDPRLVGATLQGLQFDAYGWFTGHYAYLDNLNVTGAVASTGMQSTAELFANHGELGVSAKLANASYHLRTDDLGGKENDDPKYNIAGGDIADKDFAELSGGTFKGTSFAGSDWKIKMLSEADLGVSLTGLTSDRPFQNPGLEGGIYTNANAAAIVAETTDALFISFRGTNDNSALWPRLGKYFPDNKIPASPDGLMWEPKEHYFKLFEPLFQALGKYDWATHGITDVYLTGHSLGAAMVNALMVTLNNWPTSVPLTSLGNLANLKFHADTFADPGFVSSFLAGPVPSIGSELISNIKIEHDPINETRFLTVLLSDVNTIHHNLDVQLVGQTDKLHYMTYYLEFAKMMQSEGFGTSVINHPWSNGVNYNDFYMYAETSSDKKTITVGGQADVIDGSYTNDVILGGAGNDSLSGNSGQDLLYGGNGNDRLYGGRGQDFLFGGSGDDYLDGGARKDILEGGAGNDTFVFWQADVSKQKALADHITDFAHGDKIDLTRVDANITLWSFGLDHFNFIESGAFSGAGEELRYQIVEGTTEITGDRDGNKKPDFWLILDHEVVLTGADFVLSVDLIMS